MLRLVRPALERAPTAFGWALCALDLHLSTPRELAILGQVDSEVARAALRPWQPTTVVAVGPDDEVPLLAGKTLVDGDLRRVPLRAVRMPGSDHGSRADLSLLRAGSNFPGRPLSKFTRRSNLAFQRAFFDYQGESFYA